MAKLDNITGQKFGRLTALEYVGPCASGASWKCVCECANEVTVAANNLRSGNSKSCGCLADEKRPTNNFIHGMWKSDEYRIWQAMKRRCSLKNSHNYKHYGERGIKVCHKWQNSFVEFYKDMGARPSKKHSIDRINVNGNYEPSNCKWSTWKEQANNKQ